MQGWQYLKGVQFKDRRRARSVFIIGLILLWLITVAGCAWWDKMWGPGEERVKTPDSLYSRGKEYYDRKDYDKAIEAFRRVKEEYPLSQVAIMAELGIADSYFSDDKFVDAQVFYSEFVELHPINPNVPYAMYQLGMCHYNQMETIDRDQTETAKARTAFERLITRFPNSKFSFLGEKRLKECKERLAEHEFYVGHFYFKSKKYYAAMRRFEGITKNYPNLGLDYKVNYFLAESKRLWEKEKLEKKEPEKEDVGGIIRTPVQE
jgi:outer membrane protein assembly factor BamD